MLDAEAGEQIHWGEMGRGGGGGGFEGHGEELGLSIIPLNFFKKIASFLEKQIALPQSRQCKGPLGFILKLDICRVVGCSTLVPSGITNKP